MLTATGEVNSHVMDSQASPASVQPKKMLPDENSSVTISSQARRGDVELDPRGMICDLRQI